MKTRNRSVIIVMKQQPKFDSRPYMGEILSIFVGHVINNEFS